MKKDITEFEIRSYNGEKVHLVVGNTYGGEGYSGMTDGVDVKGKLTEINIILDSATIWCNKLDMPCAVKLRSIYTI